jgi:hypothetical protein
MSTEINISKSVAIADEGTQVTTSASQIDFVGDGVTASAVGGNVTVSIAGAFGPFGIADTTGAYTYYNTLNDAMIAALAGQTVEVFTDYTETTSLEIILKDGVNINGNGHTFVKNTNNTSNIFTTVTGAFYECSIINYHVWRKAGAGMCFLTAINNTGRIDFTGTIFRSTGGGRAAEITGIDVLNLTGISTTAATALVFVGGALGSKIKNVHGINTDSGIGLHIAGSSVNAELCSGESKSGDGFYCDGRALNCTGYSSSGRGFVTLNFVQNCTGRAVSGIGFVTFYDTNEVLNCVGSSISGFGFSSQGGNASGCSGLSQTSYGTQINGGLARHYNSYSTSYLSPSMWCTNAGGTQQIINGALYSRWGNITAYGIRGNGGLMPGIIANMFFSLTNIAAPYLFNDGIAASISLRGNTYQGGGAYNVNLTQAITATEDNQGNIFL